MKEPVYTTTVVSCQPEKDNSSIYLLKLDFDPDSGFTAEAGQFALLKPGDNRSKMPRPFSVVDIEGKVVSFLINVVGKNTKIYSQSKPRDIIEVMGPRGTAIPINADNYILVAASVGAAGLIPLAKELMRMKKKVVVLLGGKEEKDICGVEFFKEYDIRPFIITETGEDRKGLVTDLLKVIIKGDECKSTVVACGPKLMLEKVALLSTEHGNECFVMLEENMACGRGCCKGCAVPGKNENTMHVCVDGPAINSARIDWPKYMSESIVELKVSQPLPDDAMKVELGFLRLRYPTMNASGCLGLDALEKDLVDYSKIGAFVTKTVTVKPRLGNKTPRVCETDSGMLNSIGLENSGKSVFFRYELPRWFEFGKPVFVNISGSTIEEYVELARAVNDTPAAGIEVNISCRNVEKGIAFGINSDLAWKVTQAVRQAAPKKIIIIKLTPNVTDIVPIAEAAVDAGADMISLVNTFHAMAIDVKTGLFKLGAGAGGLSGPAIMPQAVYRVRQVYKANLGVPIVGMGGIETGEDAAQFIMAGANLVAIGTGGFKNPHIFNQVADGLEKVISLHCLPAIKLLVGYAS